jgi:hypothetical protein
MNPQTARLVSLIILWSLTPATLVACFMLADDLILRRVMLFVLLGEAGLAAVIQPLVSLPMVLMFMYQFIRYLRLLDRLSHNMIAALDLPRWAQHDPDPASVLAKLGQAGRHVGGTSLGTEEFKYELDVTLGGRHRVRAV